MKKKVEKLVLAKETVRNLGDTEMKEVAAGATRVSCNSVCITQGSNCVC